MNTTQSACYSLMASAFVLAAVLVVQLQQRSILPAAHAEQVINRGSITAMTALTRNGEESLFVLDNLSQKLLVYHTEIRGGGARKGEMTLVGSTDLAKLFEKSGEAPAGNKRSPR